MTEDWQKPQQTVDERITRLENKVKTLEMQLASPLVTLIRNGSTIGQALLQKFDAINETLAEHAVSIADNDSRISDSTYRAIDTAIDTEELRAAIEPFATGQLIPASSLRDASKHWRSVIAMLRTKATQGVAISHLKAASIGISRRGKFIYFIKEPRNAT